MLLVRFPPEPTEVTRVASKGNRRYQSHSLMDFQHVGPFIQQGLLLGTRLSLIRRETQLLKRRFGLAAGGSIRQVPSRGLRLRLQLPQSNIDALCGTFRDRDVNYFRSETVAEMEIS